MSGQSVLDLSTLTLQEMYRSYQLLDNIVIQTVAQADRDGFVVCTSVTGAYTIEEMQGQLAYFLCWNCLL